jgi:acetyl esterase/lipase
MGNAWDRVRYLEDGARVVPERRIPVPSTVSEAARRRIASHSEVPPMRVPATAEKLDGMIAAGNRYMRELEARALEKFPVNLERTSIAGVRVAILDPPEIPAGNRDKILLNLHGGYFVFGEDCFGESIPVAATAKVRTVAVDYRIAPKHPFPASIEDGVTVYRRLLQDYEARNIGIFGDSAGGNLACALTLRIRELGLPLPAGVAMSTPLSDLSRCGDSWETNYCYDSDLSSAKELNMFFVELYAGMHDRKDPLLSPVYGDFSKGFPPSLLITGTRDMLLSSSILLHRAIRRAGRFSDLHVFEAMGHGIDVELPESDEALGIISSFFEHVFSGCEHP